MILFTSSLFWAALAETWLAPDDLANNNIAEGLTMALDLEKFVKHLKDNALPGFGQGKCATHVRKALQAGGAFVTPNVASAKNYGPVLLQIGFREIEVKDPGSFHFLKGDVMVMQPYTNGNINGHVAGYTGTKWVSDFVQTDFWAGPGYRAEKPAYVVYRY